MYLDVFVLDSLKMERKHLMQSFGRVLLNASLWD
jgi:hypothetical protein